ncbi:MAG: thioesterase family protein [Candidatus Didemnitutus sp.]|nr:thioesterase family protein [Candidatus Didemnitutus sp.]
MITSRSTIQVRYAETDMMGVVYHGNYLAWFEVGRTQLLRECGVVYRELESNGFRLPVIEVGCKYLRPALYDDHITVVTTLAERPLSRIRLAYEVFRGDTLLVTGFTVHGFINLQGAPVRPPAIFREAMRAHFGTDA